MKSAKSIAVRSGKMLTLPEAQVLLNAPDIATTKGCAPAPSPPCRSVARCGAELAALTDGRSSGGFTPEATAAARRGHTPELSVCACDFRPLLFGVWPAVTASRLDPVEALRYE